MEGTGLIILTGGVDSLVVEGLTFRGTFQRRKGAQSMVENWKKYGRTFVLRPYGVDIDRVNPKTGEVTSWDKVPGWSVWGLQE